MEDPINPLATGAPPQGQVCDRCRQKKIKCDGATPSCSNCTAVDAPCEVSAKLRRRAKFRGYSTSRSNDATIERLETENVQLKVQLQNEVQKSKTLRQELDRAHEQLLSGGRPLKVRKTAEQANVGAHSPVVSLSGDSELSSLHRSAFVIKHMGRMVFDQDSVGRFAGSTTGVHFVVSVEDLCRRLCPTLQPFPEDCYRLHLVPAQFSSSLLAVAEGFPASRAFGVHDICTLLNHPVAYYVRQAEMFNQAWSAHCPIIPLNKFARDVNDGLLSLRSGGHLNGKISSAIQTLVMVMLINQLYGAQSEISHDMQQYFALSCQLHPQVVARADVESLQALILFSFYLQISGQTSWLVQVNGIQVRLAQSLGMHRHARRFRFTESETELRKRMWWWVYCFDKLTSVIHGMPKLINDHDVDNDLPIDCELTDTDAAGLIHPLPGESTPVSLYVQYIHICKLLSSILGQLYTTSQRRGGEEKISRLDRDLRVWHQGFSSVCHMSPCDTYDVDQLTNKSRWQRFGDDECVMIAWLDLMANYAVFLIHRPALTFDNVTQRFRESVNVCLKSSSAIIQLAKSSNLHERAIYQAPFGAAIIFQSALMHVFHRCNLESISTQSDHTIVTHAISILRSMRDDTSNPFLRRDSISAAIQTLETLSNTFLKAPSLSQEAATDGNDPLQGSIVVPFQTDESVGLDFSTASALESLNHLDIFYYNWDSATPFATHVQ